MPGGSKSSWWAFNKSSEGAPAASCYAVHLTAARGQQKSALCLRFIITVEIKLSQLLSKYLTSDKRSSYLNYEINYNLSCHYNVSFISFDFEIHKRSRLF